MAKRKTKKLSGKVLRKQRPEYLRLGPKKK